MSKLILCSGERTAKPYGFPSSGIRVYSMEELCYYLFHHIYLIEEEIFKDDLIDWIQTELKLPERAEKLRKLKERGADAKSMVTVVLCSADYYTEYEIKTLLKELDEIAAMPELKKSCLKAKNYLDKRQYREASAEYERLLTSKQAKEFTPEEYGDLLHNLAVARLHTIGLGAAVPLFEQAYVRNRKEETLKQLLLALKILDWEERYQEKLEEYQAEEALRISLEKALKDRQEEAAACIAIEKIGELKRMKTQGQPEEYYHTADQMLEGWIEKIRQI